MIILKTIKAGTIINKDDGVIPPEKDLKEKNIKHVVCPWQITLKINVCVLDWMDSLISVSTETKFCV